jgi:hypothetical protein
LAAGLTKNDHVEELDLCMLIFIRLYVDDNVIGDDGAKCLAEMTVGHKSLKNLYIGNNWILIVYHSLELLEGRRGDNAG